MLLVEQQRQTRCVDVFEFIETKSEFILTSISSDSTEGKTNKKPWNCIKDERKKNVSYLFPQMSDFRTTVEILANKMVRKV